MKDVDLGAGHKLLLHERPLRLYSNLPFHAAFHSLRDRVCPQDHLWPAHLHEDYEMMFIIEGKYRCLLNGLVLEVPPGGLLVIKPGDQHQDHTENPLRFRALIMRIVGLGSRNRSLQVFDPSITPQEQILLRQPPDIPGLLDALAAECARNDRFSESMVDMLSLRILCRILREFPDRAKIIELRETSEDAIFARDIIECLRADLKATLRMEDYAKQLRVSSRTLTMRCQRLFGTSPAKLFLGIRLRQAQDFLLRTTLPIKEISHQLGFASQFHFSNAYRRWAGHPPSAERESVQKGPGEPTTEIPHTTRGH